MNSPKTSLKTSPKIRLCLGFAQPVTGRRACDGPSCRSSQGSESRLPLNNLWRSVTLVTVRPAIPSRSSESRFSVPNFRFSKCFETRHCDGPSCAWRSVVGSVASASFCRIEVCCSKRLNRSLQTDLKEMQQEDLGLTWSNLSEIVSI